ncbi:MULTISPECIES: carbohydrate ABC transporter permease [Enterocloster]|uniref:Multiple sugar transport system permease protein n=1 Tax=Enterocloster lavalensis TaxID=460384 RepID=A0A1I0DEM4_9FIRM|nr:MULTISPECIES: carbohydrate ABC transporter permease [Enterocloster]MBS5603348.1 carbohydrate ABC transporter permease [Enterocloster asparagiformis]MDR3757931.1 carbohydrate ABC transporter permease [Enterocloster sp.]PST35199.1 carbohydrate ABC transporter permease [Enterocloster lavalensis]SET30782.1 multiple sugar transport system permease protein [Enterocloster lavalensis]
MTGILLKGLGKRPLLRAVNHVVLAVASAAAVFPFLWMVLSSFKTKAEVMEPGLALPAVWQWGNYREILLESPIPRYLFNSLFVASLTMALQVVCCALFSYAVVFMRFKGRRLLFSLVLFTYMVPTAATYIPCYVLLARLGLLDSYRGLILSNGVSVFGIFLLRQAFGQIPAAAVEAARMDGAGHFTVLWHIALPMARPSVVTFMLLAFIGTYNSYMWPSLITDTPEKSLISQGLRRFLYEGGAYGTQWPLVMAAGTVGVLPLLALFAVAQRRIMAGITDMGTKG